jgi:NitT/TauT family transport system permease protein
MAETESARPVHRSTATESSVRSPPSRSRSSAARPTNPPHLPSPYRSAAIYAAVPLVAATALVATTGLSLGGIASYLPTASVDMSYSFLRMLAAYALSLGFSLAYGYYASTHRGGERVMIPVLDILQSVPILGFFPFALLLFAGATPGSWVGPNFASVFLIFTSMAWNMVFGVYESLKTLPSDLKEAADTFGISGSLRFRRVLFPATVNRLVYNSVLSWTAGWFFLVECEIFSTNSAPLPGIGSYLSFAASASNGTKFLAGILVLVTVIALLDFGLWRPLGRFAERFRYDSAPSGEAGEIEPARDTTGRFRRAAAYVTRGVRTGVTRISTPLVQLAAITVRPGRKRSELRRSLFYYAALGTILVICWLLLIAIAVGIIEVFSHPIAPAVRSQLALVPFAMGASALRVVTAFALCLAIALPLAIKVARSSRGSRVGLPVIEVIASFPATALFPVIIFELIPYLSEEGAAILMLMTGMIWYLFFNILSGIRSLPPDLEEAARSFGVKGRQFYRRVLIPGIYAALITGSITAFGGGWNTLIVAEYLNNGTGKSLSILGIGQQIDIATSLKATGYPLMVVALLTLVGTVIAINELIWKPLYRRAVVQYHYD